MNFGGNEISSNYSDSSIIILPVPYDETSTWIRGSDKGPDAIMEASVNLEFYDIETDSEVHLKGIWTAEPVLEKRSPEALVEAVHKKVLYFLDAKKFVVVTGGNHTVSIGAAKAFSEHFADLSVLQLDAHTDLRQEYEGSLYNHACTMARIREFAPVIQTGIRSMSREEISVMDRSRVFFAHEIYSGKTGYQDAIGMLTENVYITIDLDVFDPSLMPSTGTPEPGGPSYFEIMHFLKDVIMQRNVVGFDIVELCPSPGNKAPDFIAAKIIYQLLSYRFC